MIMRLTTASLLALVCAGSVQAQVFGSGVSGVRDEMNSRFETTNRAQFELLNQNAELREEVSRLRGEIEVLQHEIETLRNRQQDFYVDLDNRLLRLETGGATGTPGGASADPAAEAAAYEQALELLKESRHADALASFREFINAYPQSSFLPNAHFWAGNAALQAKEVAEARTLFDTVIKTWPEDPVVPDAMLGLANSQTLLGERRAAQETLSQIVSQHPGSSAAQVARQRIQQ